YRPPSDVAMGPSSTRGSDRAEGEDTMPSETVNVEAGAVTFSLHYRALMPDQGVCIQVMGDVSGKKTELLRFDCVDQAPHYHYAPLAKNERRDIDKTTAGNPVGWALRQLRGRLPEMLEHAGFDDIASGLDGNLVASKLDEVEEAARSMAISQRRIVL